MTTQVNGELVPQGGGDCIPLRRSPLIVGRRESCDICLQFPNVSGKHCELTFRDGFWILHDLNSTNGVKVNDARLDHGAKKVLHDGDIVTIVKRSYKIQYHETGRASDLAEFEEEIENVFSIPLLEKAELLHPPRRAPKATSEPDE